MGTNDILDSDNRMRTPTQQQHPQNQVHPPPSTSRRPLPSAQAGHLQFLPSSSPGVQTQTQAPHDASGTLVAISPHPSASQGGNILPSSSAGSPQRHYPPSLFQQNQYPGQYTLSQQLPPFPTAHPQAYPYTHARGYVPHFPLEAGQYQQNPLGFRPMMQAHSPHNAGGHCYPSGGNSGMHFAAHSPTAHSPLPMQQPPPGASGSPSISQYQHVRYSSPYTPYHYSHAYQPNPYQWYYNSPVPPEFNEGIPMHYQHQYPIHFPHLHDSPSADLETRFSQVSMHGGPALPVQSTAPPAALLARHPPQVPQAASAPPSSSAPVSNSPAMVARSERPPSTVTTPPRPHSERPIVRRVYHPNPPSHRSEWVMWIGNVPGGTTHDELWKFLKRSPSMDNDSSESEDNGVLSIFLISRSNCAFVNFDTEVHLRCAIVRFNGQQLHPHERRGPRLVCRARRKEDDLRAGVGGQRGVGVHTRYVREQSQQGQTQVAPSEDDRSSPTDRYSNLSSESGYPLAVPVPLLSSDVEARPALQMGGSVKAQSSSSYASTNSSFLSRHFPKRFFILKSLTQSDLDLSVENGLWATQRHNEAILDQAYRTSNEVILIFSVNKSGEFYGYARMASRILQGEHKVSWALHADSSTTSLSSPRREHGSPSPLVATNQFFFTPSEHRLVEESPMPFTPYSGGCLSNKTSPMEPHRASAPAALGPLPRREFSVEPPAPLSESGKVRPVAGLISKDFVNSTPDIVLDKNAPVRAVRNKNKGSTDGTKSGVSALQAVEEENNSISSDDGDAGEEQLKDGAMPSMTKNAGDEEQQGWGQEFKVEWLCTDRLPFHSTRHLRNPWNHDREIKVSRDGTEVEPGVGQQLLEQWQTLAAAPTVTETSKSTASIH